MSRTADVRVMRWWDYVIFAAISALIFTGIWQLATYWIALPDWRSSPWIMLLLTALIANNIFVHQYRWFGLLLMRRPRPLPAPPGLRVAAVTTFVPAAEPIEMLEVTLRAMSEMDYPHDTWVLDEGNDPAVAELCRRYGAHHYSRRDKPEYLTATGTFQRRSKHGNYNAWLFEQGFDAYDIIVAFDPDHVPRRHFLTRVLGYFSDASVGYVQAAQMYYNQSASFIARGAAEETYAYYSATQMACYGVGYPIVTGCHQAHRSTALKEVGGFASHDADDLLITMLYRAAGWHGVYVPEALAAGLTPVDWNGYLTQQLRWARSVLDVKFRAFPKYARKLRPQERLLSLLHGMYYFQGLTVFVTVAALCALIATDARPSFLSSSVLPNVSLLAIALLIANLYVQRFFILPKREAGIHWRAMVLQLAKWPYLLLGLIEAVRGTNRPYALTLKVRRSDGANLLAIPHLALVLLLAGAWFAGHNIHGQLNASVRVWAGALIAISLLLICTEQLSYPAPYERAVWDAYEHG